MSAPDPGPIWHWIVGALFWPVVLVLLVVAGAAWGQTAQCAMRDKVVERLAASFGESRRGIGLARNAAVMELFASDATGTWTITVTLANGMTCLVASGQAFEALTDPLPAPGEDG